MAGWLLHLGERRDRAVLRWSGIIMFGAATIFAVGWQAIILNPVMPYIGAPVEGWFLFDSLLLAYALPALLYAVIGIYRLGPRPVWQSAQILAAGFAFLWVTLEIRHLFHGERLNQGITGEAEWYAYSAAWLAFASAGLAAALIWRKPLAAPRLAARHRPGGRQGVPVRHGRPQRRIAGALLHRPRRGPGRPSATPIGGCSRCSPRNSLGALLCFG